MPPVSNKVPRAARERSCPLYLWGKFKMLILGDDPPMMFFPGNAGSAGAEASDEEDPEMDVAIVARRRRRRLPGVPVLHSAVLHRAAETFSQADGRPPPPVVTDIADPAERAIAERGRYIVMTHRLHRLPRDQRIAGPGSARSTSPAADLKIQTPHGTFVSRNLTPDKETGLGRRTDDEVKRVLRSGVFPDGHVVADTVMPWANFSNWTEEDRHAVVVYLRHLPADPARDARAGPGSRRSPCRARSSRTTAGRTTA